MSNVNFLGLTSRLESQIEPSIQEIYDPEIDEILKLQAQMKPLNLQSMSQINKDKNFGKPGVSWKVAYMIDLLH